MKELEKKIIAECKEDVRVVACRFPLPNIEPEAEIGSDVNTVWLYKIPKTWYTLILILWKIQLVLSFYFQMKNHDLKVKIMSVSLESHWVRRLLTRWHLWEQENITTSMHISSSVIRSYWKKCCWHQEMRFLYYYRFDEGVLWWHSTLVTTGLRIKTVTLKWYYNG